MYPVGAGRSFGVSDFISLKDEYRNMADGVLPLTNDPMPNINTNKQGWGTDAAGTDLTEGDKYKDLINVKGAKFLDLVNSSSVKIDDADDLKEALKEYDVEMSIAFNDNPDNDEFRKAYIVVITGLKDKGETPVGPTTGAIRYATSDMTNTYGALSDTSSFVQGNGTVVLDGKLTVPAWVADTLANGSDNTVSFTYDIYKGTTKYMQDMAGSLTLTGLSDTKRTFDLSTTELNNGWSSPSSYASGDSVSVVIKSVKYGAANVRYFDKVTGEQIVDRLMTTSHATKTTKIMNTTGAADVNIHLSNSVYTAATAGLTLEFKGAKDPVDPSTWALDTAIALKGIVAADNAAALKINTAGGLRANGDGYVDITIGGLTHDVKYVITKADTLSAGVAAAIERGTAIAGTWPAAAPITVDKIGAVDDTIPAKASWTDAVKITLADDVTSTGITGGTATVITATVAGDTDAVAYNVVLEITDKDGKHSVKFNDVADGTPATASFTLTSDAKITGLSASVSKPHVGITSVTISGNQMTINFNTGVYGGWTGGAAPATGAVGIAVGETLEGARSDVEIANVDHVAGGKTVILTFKDDTNGEANAVLKAGDVFKILTNKVTGASETAGEFYIADITVDDGAKTATVSAVSIA